MAALDRAPGQSHPPAQWTTANTRAQFRAIARLRWLIFRNTLRRKGGTGDLIATIISVPIFLSFVFGPAVAAAILSYLFVEHGTVPYIAFVLWGIFILGQLSSIQLGQPSTTFDPTQLIRFPLNFRGYLLIRIFFGLLAPANIFSTICSAAVFGGIAVADPSLAVTAFFALGAFILANVFFTRMVFTWVDRWLATRRSREIFTGLIFFFSLGIQWLNFTFNPGFQHGRHRHGDTAAHLSTAQHLYSRADPLLGLLPPGLAVKALTASRTGALASSALAVCGILLFAAIFLMVFAWRMYREFRGETLSEQANAVAKLPVSHVAAKHVGSARGAGQVNPARFSPPPVVAGVFAKEFLTMRRNTGVFYAIVAPLVMVVLIVSKLAARAPVAYVFPAAVAYTMLGIAPLAYNTLGLEAAGVQFYFLAPVRWRDVFLAKNLMTLLLAAIEFMATLATIAIASHMPSFRVVLSALLWTIAVLAISFAIGNYRSVISPSKLDPAKLNRKQTTGLSALISIGTLLVFAAIGALCFLAADYFDLRWLLPAAMLAFALGGLAIYRASLNGIDATVARNRDVLIEKLCKAA